MRIALISDIHGNALALDVVIAELRRETLDHTICLGDAVQGGPQPAETVARLRAQGWPVVMGNADAWLLTGKLTTRTPIDSARLEMMENIRRWALERLSLADQAYISRFAPTVDIALDDGRLLRCFHGSPVSFDDIILPTTPEAEFNALLAPYTPDHMAGGHTHMQQIRRVGYSESVYINPGSVGLAYSHHQPADDFRTDAWAEYAILNYAKGRMSVDFRRVPYDGAALRAIYRASGRPHAEDSIQQYEQRTSAPSA